MGLLDRVKAGAEQAASSAQRQAQVLQTKRELSQAYHELGKIAHGLVERGEVTHGDLTAPAAHVNELQSRLEGQDGGEQATQHVADAGTAGAGEADIIE